MINVIKKFKLGILLFIGILLFPIEVIGQRVFAPSEDGTLVELKENGMNGKFLIAWYKPNLPRKMQEIITEPLKLYIYSEQDIDNEEFFVQQMTQLKQGVFFLPPSGKAKKNYYKATKADLKRISPTIYEFTLPENSFLQVDDDAIAEAKINGNKMAAVKQFVIAYRPNKEHKKDGQKDMYWYANISQLPYDSEDIGEWSNETAIESVNQLMSEGKTTEQLFASIKPQQPQVVNGQQIQYVVIQNQESPVAQNNQQKTEEGEKSVEIVSDVDKNIPYRDINNENTFALIIANENYNKVAPVNFALRDGQKINEYLKKTLGIEKSHIAYLENATLNDMRYEVNRLSKISDAYNGEASFIIYYIGHGIPDEKNGNGYLLPVDGYGNDVTTAYPLEELYSQLGSLDAKKIILFTDACFSGANKTGEMLVAARGIAIRSNPNEAKGRLIAFSACQGDETAYSYDEQGHGLLTYYFLKKLKETGGQTTLGELEEYIVDNVGKTAILINGKSQTPRVSVSPELQETWRDHTLFE